MALDDAQEIYLQAGEEVDDDSFEFEDYLKDFNKGQKEISGRVLLPALETFSELVVGTASLTASTISFTETGHIIADSDSAFVSSGFHAGQTITITGAGESGNNQTTTISSVASDGSQIVVAGDLTDEAAGEEVTIENDSPNYVPLPSTYQRNLFYCYSTTHNRSVRVYKSRALLMREFTKLDLTGRVIGVAVYGSNLYYQRVPSTETLRIHFYEFPTDMTGKTSTPDCLPEHLATPLLKAFSCWKRFAKIEDGIDGQKVNTAYWKQRFEGNGPGIGGFETGGLMADLAAFLGPEREVPEEIPDDIGWENLIG